MATAISQHRTLRGLLYGFVVSLGLLLPAPSPAAIGAAPSDDHTPVASHARALRDYESASRRWKADTNNLEASWQLGRACFDLADAATNNTQRAQIAQEGIIASRRATVIDPKLAAGYYYLGLNLGQLARARPLSAIGILDDVESAWLSAIALDPKFEYSGSHRAIGVLYRDAPGWPLSLGNRKKSLFHLEKAVEVSPDYPGNRLYLLETWLKWGKKDEARAALDVTRKVMEKAPASFTGPAWTEALADWDRRWKRIADQLK
jgi:tetratricopeptide (TPR) repeat protein